MPQTLVKKKINLKKISEINSLISKASLHTVCKEALCPNRQECFQKAYLTFLILGDVCTRDCQFCSVKKGIPGKLDLNEPYRVKEATRSLKLKHVVLTSPTRDDLADGGALFFSQAVKEVRKLKSVESIEVLIPDFQGNIKSLSRVVESEPDIFGHNLETVSRLYQIRKGADYFRSLSLLKAVKEINPQSKTKSALLLGLGEGRREVLDTIKDLAKVGCSYLALGQYLAPRKSNYPVKRIVPEQEFKYYKEKACSLGFLHVEAGTYVRSSYHANRYLNKVDYDDLGAQRSE